MPTTANHQPPTSEISPNSAGLIGCFAGFAFGAAIGVFGALAVMISKGMREGALPWVFPLIFSISPACAIVGFFVGRRMALKRSKPPSGPND